MKKLFTTSLVVLCLQTAYGQTNYNTGGYQSQLGSSTPYNSSQTPVPHLSVPYIPIRPAKSREQIGAEINAARQEQGRLNYLEFKKKVDKLFQDMVLNADMLPLKKLSFQKSFDWVRSHHDAEMLENPEGCNSKLRVGS